MQCPRSDPTRNEEQLIDWTSGTGMRIHLLHHGIRHDTVAFLGDVGWGGQCWSVSSTCAKHRTKPWIISVRSTKPPSSDRWYSTIGSEHVVPVDFVPGKRMSTYHSRSDCTCLFHSYTKKPYLMSPQKKDVPSTCCDIVETEVDDNLAECKGAATVNKVQTGGRS